MKIIKYKIHQGKNDEHAIFLDVEMPWSQNAEMIAKKEAYNGEYEISDDGIEEIIKPTQLDRIESQIAYLAMMTGNSEILEG